MNGTSDGMLFLLEIVFVDEHELVVSCRDVDSSQDALLIFKLLNKTYLVEDTLWFCTYESVTKKECGVCAVFQSHYSI